MIDLAYESDNKKHDNKDCKTNNKSNSTRIPVGNTSYALYEKSKTAMTTETANLILLKSMVKLAKLDRVLLVRNETLERFTTLRS